MNLFLPTHIIYLLILLLIHKIVSNLKIFVFKHHLLDYIKVSVFKHHLLDYIKVSVFKHHLLDYIKVSVFKHHLLDYIKASVFKHHLLDFIKVSTCVCDIKSNQTRVRLNFMFFFQILLNNIYTYKYITVRVMSVPKRHGFKIQQKNLNC